MIPSLVASEVTDALRDFLATGFGPSNPAMAGVMADFLAQPENLAKGPYLSVALPYQRAPEGGEPFPELPLGFTPYRHQRIAMRRLADGAGRSAIIAAGTGSGKTECFLYPILDHCLEQAGQPGIKAILVYPMNALAMDQARRIAAIIHEAPALRGKVSAGLYIGEGERFPHRSMGRRHVITDRSALRERPPDILLTNYKMLDFLMVRPRDQRLWRRNRLGTLRYLVVDELHTFDGAQGTDLACLIRRLRARLQVPRNGLICAGTSATIGGRENQEELLEYASRIFGQPFEPDAVIGEFRQSIDEFLGNALIRTHLSGRENLADQVDPGRYLSSEEYIEAQHQLFFGQPIRSGFHTNGWRVALAGKLREHLAFVNLLRALEGRPKPFVEVVERLRPSLPLSPNPETAAREATGLVQALCALVSVARQATDSGEGNQEREKGRGKEERQGEDADGKESHRPFLQVGLHLWVRELRRMVCSVCEPFNPIPGHTWQQGEESSHPAAPDYPEDGGRPHRLRHSDDLKPDEACVHLPLIQCRECRVTGWGTVQRPGELRIEQDLSRFYNQFFSRDLNVRFFFPAPAPPSARGLDTKICGACGLVQAQPSQSGHDEPACRGCGKEQLVQTFCPDAVVRGKLSRDCPYCRAKEALIILGARASSLLSVALGQTFASKHNDDHGAHAPRMEKKGDRRLVNPGTSAASHTEGEAVPQGAGAQKLIAFSDNVQDAAHRAGFFAARTWQNSLRAAIAQVIAKHDGISLAELPDKVVSWWRNPAINPGAFDPMRFVAEFIAPDRQWLRGFRELQNQGQLSPASDIIELVAQRLRWDTLAELGYRSAIGRTLERTGVAAVGVEREALLQAVQSAHRRLSEEFEPFRGLPAEPVRFLLLGLLRRMRERGAIHTTLTESYVASGGDPWRLGGRNLALQDFGPRSPLPVFPARRPGKAGLEALAQGSGGVKSWYQKWVEKVLTHFNPMAAHYAAEVLDAAFAALESVGLVRGMEAGKTEAWAMLPERFYVTERTLALRGDDRAAKALGEPLLSEPNGPAWAGAGLLGHRQFGRPGHALLVAEQEADLWRGAPCLDLALSSCYGEGEPSRRTWFGRLYREAAIRRIVAAEHTALIAREERDRLQERFANPTPQPWEPNVLSATPTLELGIDIGDLSAVAMCSVPPAPENYLQRIGRAGRREGNAFTLTVATGQPHDLYYYAEPLDMLASRVAPPGVFLNASAVLERQLTAFCLDNWVADGVAEEAVPRTVRAVLDAVEAGKLTAFPYPFFDFVERRSKALLNAFLDAFAGDLTEASRAYLADFLRGDGGGRAQLALRILNRFLEVAKERKAVRADIEALQRRLAALQQDPGDEATEREIADLAAERRGLQGILRQINGRNLFAFLTDEGLLPNYAFPQEGVTLRSVIHHRADRSGAGEDEPHLYEYVRPAESALSELAPENQFYAGGRRVSITRIDTRVSAVETWRLCRACAYCENLELGDHHNHCPRCGDPMWADAGQRHHMLPLRLVHAFTPDSRSRILDEKDDREPLFYTRHLVADFEPSAIRSAYAIAKPDAPFGFEYIAKARFREMNFGRVDDRGLPTLFAGVERPRGGFRVCRQCGLVQAGANDAPKHARNCRSKGDADIVNCLYLYRTFESEAVRMLLPIAEVQGSDRRKASFIAALELGLRLRFRGRLHHLRAMPGDNALSGNNQGRSYLMLYDTVPGGTGYLKDLLAARGNLLDVFQKALAALQSCECSRDPERDGCYRCVYAYRRSRDMALTSRTTAIEILTRILERAEDLVPVEGLDQVDVNALLESELEARFIEALRRIKIDGATPQVRQELVRGKPGYLLKLNTTTWFIEPQAELGAADGVAAPSRPDFLIHPVRASEAPPVALFMDGFEYHRDRVDQDSLKRMALVRAGFVVWSLTWHDLEVAFGKPPDALDFLEVEQNDMAEVQQQLDRHWDAAARGGPSNGQHLGPSSIRRHLHEPSLALLLRYLMSDDPEKALHWRQALFTALLGLFDQQRMLSAELRTRFQTATSTLPGQVREALNDLDESVALAGKGAWLGASRTGFDLFLALPLAAVQPPEPDEMAAIIHLHDDEASCGHPEYRQVWNGVLRLFNLLQFLPGTWFTTRQGTAANLYPEFVPTQQPAATAPNAWEEALSLAVPDVHPAMQQWAALGLPAPEVGYELADRTGRILAEAELAWAERKVAILLPDAAAPEFESAGWRAFFADSENLVEWVALTLAEGS